MTYIARGRIARSLKQLWERNKDGLEAKILYAMPGICLAMAAIIFAEGVPKTSEIIAKHILPTFIKVWSATNA